ncbi:hypothetical protein OC846_000491 [Tilletia horrida]|uniref:Uncharacterized protein n=1 Tax=Tilletia horrida TaxID=155126 RepID=A0AAN6GX21_9BASI|nr:hypothetical protein OC845_001107 [Tilletia horrida]KAK0557503.1 hypothetical protein OC846_000491 [Tilletia horrida]KAK0567880.1 hypothetical protein OC861_002440 [Tilletia horrida]
MSTKSQTLDHMSNADQKNHGGDDNQATRHEEGKPNSHQALDSKDEKSIANKLDQAAKELKEAKKAEKEKEDEPFVFEAEKNGNKPSRGAVIDAQIEQEEQEELERKGKA